jgi:hypothetical protein
MQFEDRIAPRGVCHAGRTLQRSVQALSNHGRAAARDTPIRIDLPTPPRLADVIIRGRKRRCAQSVLLLDHA